MFYKETEFQVTKTGKIPSDWQAATLSELSEHITKGTTPTTYGFSYESSGVNFIKVESIDENGKFIVENVPHISEEANKALSRSILKEKDILFSIAGALGRVALVTDDILPANVNQALSIVRIKEQEKVLPEYLKYFLMGPNVQGFVKSIAIQSQQANLNLEQVRDFKVGLPPVAEQKAIVGVLGVVDSAIEYADQIIAKTERLKRGLMQQLLTRGIGHTETKQTPIGNVPKGWSIKTLFDALGRKKDLIIAGPFGSNLKVSDYKERGVPIIRLQNINFGRFVNKEIMFVSPEKARELSYHSFVKGDIILAKLGDPIGKTCIVPDYLETGIVVADVVRIRADTAVLDKKYLMYALNSVLVSNQLNKQVIGTTRPRVNLEQVRDLIIPIPSISEQRQIASILSALDEKLELEKKQKEKFYRIKRSLMDLLLTGKIRIKVD